MNVRDYYSSLGIIAVAIVALIFVAGVGAIGYLTLSDLTTHDPGASQTPNVVEPKFTDDPPKGFTPTTVNSSVVVSPHVDALENREHTIDRLSRDERGTETRTKITVNPNATGIGTRNVSRPQGTSMNRTVYSPDSQLFIISDAETGDEIRTFADSSYVTGKNLVREVAAQDQIGLRNINRSNTPTTYLYTYDTDGSQGGLIVNERGVVVRAYKVTQENGQTVREGMQIDYRKQGDSSPGWLEQSGVFSH